MHAGTVQDANRQPRGDRTRPLRSTGVNVCTRTHVRTEPRPGAATSSSRYARLLSSVFATPMESNLLPQVALDSAGEAMVESAL